MAKEKKIKAKGATKGSRLWGLLLFLFLILIDQLTKVVADVFFVDVLEDSGARLLIIPDVIEICIAYNRGIAFSMFANAEAMVKMGIVIGTAALMVVLAILYCTADKRRTLIRVALIFIIAGGLGNFIDRMYYQVWDPATASGLRDGVRDMVMLDFSTLLQQWFGWETEFLNFGVCNVADFFIVAGGIMLVLGFLFFDRDALKPVGKYKALAKEYDEKQAEKKAAKKAKKAAKKA